MSAPAAALRNRIVGTGEAAPDQLVANPANWRTHPGPQRAALRGSLEHVGWVAQVMVNRRTGFVVDGHARIEEALARGEATIPVVYVDLEPEEEALILATLDPIGAMATRDDARLQELLSGIAIDEAGLLALLADLAPLKPRVGLTDPDDVPPLGDESGIKAGDLFALGDHRLLCGDSTSPEDLSRLMGGGLAEMVWTDPPYGVAYVGKTRDALTIQNDAVDASALVRAVFAAALAVVAPGAPLLLRWAGRPADARLRAVVDRRWLALAPGIGLGEGHLRPRLFERHWRGRARPVRRLGLHDHRRRAAGPSLLRDGDRPALCRCLDQAVGAVHRPTGGADLMGAHGPAPAPTKVKLLHGETRPSRVNYREPLPSAKLPTMPADMDDEAKRVWRRVMRTMGKTGVIRASHTDTLRCYCEAVSRYNQAAVAYASSGPLVRGQRPGDVVKNPLWQLVREGSELVRLYAREFGLSPSAQSGLEVEPEHAANQVPHDLGLPPRLRAVGNGD